MSFSYDGYARPRRIILDERKLSSEYVPLKLPHRAEQIAETLRVMQDVIRGQKDVLRTIIYAGQAGTGKTAVARTIGREVKDKAAKGKIPPILVSYVNAQEYRTKFQVFRKIGSDCGLDIPRRGFSSQELAEYVFGFISRRENNALIILDEADILAKQKDGNELFYVFSRVREVLPEVQLGLGLIVIFRQLDESLAYLDKAVVSSLSGRVVRFNPYTSQQLQDILWARIRDEGAIREEAVSEEIIEMIADTVGYNPDTKSGIGDARMAIKVLYYSALRAEGEERETILPEDVRYVVNQGVLPSYIDEETVTRLPLHEKLLLLAITELLLLEREKAYVNMGEVVIQYEDVCNKFGEKPLRYTRIWEKVQFLKKMGLVDTRTGRGETRGRTTMITFPGLPANSVVGINRIPLDLLEKILRDSIEKELSSRGEERGEELTE
ncbi:Cdc6/Cdc18 family protein [Thermofilum pendens]|uniref:ORC1-type DNA replication protein n=1 Tax=Thermofilum pendens (strain DSM 2475 / Hrk 5) TaxID=368408 RepID=A1RWU5_THEPD|nr:AAA family ATPase [Thermofilum pendens]ABL77675.1 ORC complex protein Cdc6/Orc1 [Thermofilum pendens Hrk 5]